MFFFYILTLYIFYILDSQGNTLFAQYYTLGTLRKHRQVWAPVSPSIADSGCQGAALSPGTVTWKGQDDKESYFEVLHTNLCYNQ